MSKLTHWDYCQFLLVSQTNYTQTYFGDHSEEFSHDQLNRMLRRSRLKPRELRKEVGKELILSKNGYVLFDDTVLDKNHSRVIEAVRKQWSGNAKRVIRGIGVVTCVYVNPDINRFWVIDYRIYDPERDGRSKIDLLLQMWEVILAEQLPFRYVLMDSWYTTMKIMKAIEKAKKIYYGVVKPNRNVSDSRDAPHMRADKLQWSAEEMENGKLVHLKKFPADHNVKLFWVVLSTQRTDFVVTNDKTQDSADAARDECAIRWKIEQFHREAKQTTGIESCQCRNQRAQRNHIACAMLVWVRFNTLAQEMKTNIYQLKQGLLDGYMRQQLRTPSISIRPA